MGFDTLAHGGLEGDLGAEGVERPLRQGAEVVFVDDLEEKVSRMIESSLSVNTD